MYIELIEGSVFQRNKNGRMILASTLSKDPRTTEAYTSFWSYPDAAKDYYNVGHTLKDYKGVHIARNLLVDVDSPDLDKARRTTLEVVKRLAEYGVRADELAYYFSGSKGFHVLVSLKLFPEGFWAASPELPDQVKAFVSSLFDGVEGQDCIDRSMYDRLHLVRIPNSKNEKSGLYKIPITYAELKDLSIDEIKELAKNPREDFSLPISPSQLRPKERFKEVLTRASKTVQHLDSKVEQDAPFKMPEVGGRHEFFRTQANYLFHQGADFERVKGLMHLANQGLKDPKQPEEIDKLVKDCWNHVQSSNQQTQQDIPVYSKADELLTAYFEYNRTSVQRKLSLLFPSIDNDLGHRLAGQLIVVAGQGGTKKSMYVQNIALHNARLTGGRTIFSSMEMSDYQLMERYINMTVGRWKIDEMEEKKQGSGEEFLRKNIIPQFNDKIIFTTQGSMSPEKYDKLLSQVNTDIGPVDFLIVDSLSLLEQVGRSEMESVNAHSAALKNLAKKWGICIILICHVTKEAAGDSSIRDLEPKLRGSQKLSDNLDILISLTQCVEKGTNQLRNDRIYCYYRNKRGTNARLPMIIDFQAKNLSMQETDEDPDEYDFSSPLKYDPYDIVNRVAAKKNRITLDELESDLIPPPF